MLFYKYFAMLLGFLKWLQEYHPGYRNPIIIDAYLPSCVQRVVTRIAIRMHNGFRDWMVSIEM